jgi:hypothetical protein
LASSGLMPAPCDVPSTDSDHTFPSNTPADSHPRTSSRVLGSAVNQQEEVTELVGMCLWDIFSDNHDIIAPGGRPADIGSFPIDRAWREHRRHSGTAGSQLWAAVVARLDGMVNSPGRSADRWFIRNLPLQTKSGPVSGRFDVVGGGATLTALNNGYASDGPCTLRGWFHQGIQRFQGTMDCGSHHRRSFDFARER